MHRVYSYSSPWTACLLLSPAYKTTTAVCCKDSELDYNHGTLNFFRKQFSWRVWLRMQPPFPGPVAFIYSGPTPRGQQDWITIISNRYVNDRTSQAHCGFDYCNRRFDRSDRLWLPFGFARQHFVACLSVVHSIVTQLFNVTWKKLWPNNSVPPCSLRPNTVICPLRMMSVSTRMKNQSSTSSSA